jgi:hypothetical protein
MKNFLMPLTLVLLVIAFALTATNFAVQPRVSLESTGELSTGMTATMQQAYELRCRGGGLRTSSTQGRSLPTGEQMMNMTLDFTAGTQPAGNREPNLRPGQCSWVDRGFRQGEPTQIHFEIVYFAQQRQALHGTPVDHSPNAAERYPDAQNLPQYLRSPAHYWSFWVYNTNNGYMQATGNRLFKPAPIRIIPTDKIKVSPINKDRPSNVNKRE